MEHKPLVGLAMCGSYCTYAQVFAAAAALRKDYRLLGIMSETAAETDTRFGTAVTNLRRLMELTGEPVVTTIAEADPLGPARPMDALLIAPCTGNTLGKLAHGITDPTPAYLSQFDIVILALYPQRVYEWIVRYMDALKPGDEASSSSSVPDRIDASSASDSTGAGAVLTTKSRSSAIRSSSSKRQASSPCAAAMARSPALRAATVTKAPIARSRGASSEAMRPQPVTRMCEPSRLSSLCCTSRASAPSAVSAALPTA